MLPIISFYSFAILTNVKGAVLTAGQNQMVVTVKIENLDILNCM